MAQGVSYLVAGVMLILAISLLAVPLPDFFPSYARTVILIIVVIVLLIASYYIL